MNVRLIICSLLVFLCTAHGYIRASVMLPLNTFENNGNLNNPSALLQQLQQLKSGNVDGVMVDVWWGIVEANGPRQYNWTGYQALAKLVTTANLHLQAVMSFHQCGTNVGDQCYIPLPQWVRNVGNSNPGIWYTDSQGGIDQEYLSLGVDNETIFQGRSPIQMYHDFMQSFADNMAPWISNGVINQVQVGLGPAGEMRYPSYQLQGGKWTYCGIGAFQCYDKYLLADLKQAASDAGQPTWGSPPSNAGFYNSYPSNTPFFSEGQANNYASNYGKFFLGWYSSKLITHGSNILASAASIFGPLEVNIAGKVAGIHWWYDTYSHAAECTAGYFNTDFNDAYYEIAQMFAAYNADFDFTCLEMTDSSTCSSQPQELVKQTILASQKADISYAGENALPICDPTCYQGGFNEILTEATQYGAISRFTYLRLDSNLLNGNNWSMFTNFVSSLHSASDS